MEQKAEGVGPEAAVAEAVGRAGVLEVLEPGRGLAPVDGVVVDGERPVGAGGRDEAGVGSLGQALDLGSCGQP